MSLLGHDKRTVKSWKAAPEEMSDLIDTYKIIYGIYNVKAGLMGLFNTLKLQMLA